MNWFERSDTASCSVWDSGGNQQPQQPQQKFPLKRVEPALKKCITILQIDIDRLEKHKQNIKKFEVLKDESALNKEQINASLTVQQLSSNIGQLENTRAQVQDSDLAEFDERIQQTHTEACVAVSSFLNIHNIAEQSALQEVSSNRIGPSHPRSLALSCSNDTDPVEEDDAEIEKQVQLYADQNSPSHDSWMKLEEDCVAAVQQWMLRNRLKMNPGKTELLVISSKSMVSKVNIPDIVISEDRVAPALKVKNLGVLFDHTMSLEAHVNNITKIAFFHLRNISRLRKTLNRETTERLVHAFVTSRLDCCNAILYGLPDSALHKLQRVQNAAAHVVTLTYKHDHITPVLKSLHWLPVAQRIEFKVILMVFKCVNGLAPGYLQDLISFREGRTLRSTGQKLLSIPFTRSTLVLRRSFAVAGPRAWNSLPQHLRLIADINSFKRAARAKDLPFYQGFYINF